MEKITYKHVYFRIECGYMKTDGYDHSKECMAEIAQLLRNAGWNVKEPSEKEISHCPEATLRKMYVYVHPQSVSGTIEPDQIPVIEAMLKTGKSYDYRWTDIYHDIHDFTWEELSEYHREHNGRTIMALLLDTFKTKKSNLYKPVREVINYVADQIKVDTLLKNGAGYAVDAETSVVKEIYNNLVAGGYLITSKGKGDKTIARTVKSQAEIQPQSTLF